MSMKIRRVLPLLIAATAATLTLTACSGGSGATDPSGVWGTLDEPGTPGLQFDAPVDNSGEYHGNDGCNNVGGTYTITESTIDFGVMRSTMMFCEGVDTWLSQAVTATISGDTMTLLDDSGSSIGELARQAG